LFAGAEFGAGETWLEPGDTLFAYTDGVTEAKNQDRDLFGEERLLSIIEQTNQTATAILDQINTSLLAHTAGAHPFDDITMLAVSRLLE
jgi:sigma-B regulation protein RsbU (phosphoserine phosphatase)